MSGSVVGVGQEGCMRYPQIFDVPPASGNLKRATSRGGAVTLLSQGANFFLRIGSTAVLARLLAPQDYGFVAMTSAVVGFVGLFGDAGLSWATIQKDKITHEQTSTLFWINVALGCVLGGVIVAISPLVGKFYGEPRLVGIACALALMFVFGGFGTQHRALLRRLMRFSALAWLDLVSAVLSIAVAMVAAALHLRYWSIVAMMVSAPMISTVGAWLLLRWTPGLPSRGAGVRSMLKFGGDVIGFEFSNYFAQNAANICIGWKSGSGLLGLYDRAYSILLLPIREISLPLLSVMLPALSRLKDDPMRFRHFYGRVIEVVSSFSVPGVVVMAVFANELILLWLGTGWTETALFLQYLAPGAFAGALMNPTGWLLISTGRTRQYRYLGIANATIVLVSLAAGLPFGALGVAIAFSSVRCIMILPIWWYVVRDTPMSLRSVVQALVPSVVSSIPAALFAVIVLRGSLFSGSDWSRTVIAAVIFAFAYLLLLLVAFRRWSVFRGVVNELLPDRFTGKRESAAS